MNNPCLVIVESPNKTKKIESLFPIPCKAMASFGHVCDLPRSPKEGIGIDPQSMKGMYELTNDSSRGIDGKRAVARLRDFLRQHPSAAVYLATDPDREGESISAFVMQYLKLRNPKRMRFNAITKEKIAQAYNAAGDIDWHAVSSREARRLIDRIIGYVASPALMRLTNDRKASAGRVQTAVEALIIERERKIRDHKPQLYYGVTAQMQGGWNAKWQYKSSEPAPSGSKPNSAFDTDVQDLCMDRNLAELVGKQAYLSVSRFEETTEQRLPPAPFYSFSLVQTANRVLGWDVSRTMQTAQKLFEGPRDAGGHITYHRTDSPNLDPESAKKIREYLTAQGSAVSQQLNVWPVKSGAQEGHEGIIPTHIEVEIAGDTEDERQLYKLIRDRALISQLPPAQYAVRRITLQSALGHIFTSSAKVLLEPGWMQSAAARNNPACKDDDSEDEQTDSEELATQLPKLAVSTTVAVSQMTISDHKTKPPTRYNVRTLAAKLENLGIGRPATLESIFKGIVKKGSVVIRSDKKFEPTQFAERCYDILYPHFAFAHIGYTAQLESALDQVACGKLDGIALVRAVWSKLEAECASASPAASK